jgi:hypothetical protein
MSLPDLGRDGDYSSLHIHIVSPQSEDLLVPQPTEECKGYGKLDFPITLTVYQGRVTIRGDMSLLFGQPVKLSGCGEGVGVDASRSEDHTKVLKLLRDAPSSSFLKPYVHIPVDVLLTHGVCVPVFEHTKDGNKGLAVAVIRVTPPAL